MLDALPSRELPRCKLKPFGVMFVREHSLNIHNMLSVYYKFGLVLELITNSW